MFGPVVLKRELLLQLCQTETWLDWHWVSDCCLTPIFSYIIVRTSIQWDDDVHFVLDQHTLLDF